MTATVPTARASTADRPAPAAAMYAPRRPVPMRRLVRLPAGWPVVALLAGYPIWWALGFAVLVYPLLAVPMLAHLLRRRPVKLPPGFMLWLLFLAWQVLAIPALVLNPPGTVPETMTNRLLAVIVRLGCYLAVTVMLLYVGNLTESELPRRRLVRLLAWMFLVAVAGGLLGILAPTFNFTSPLELLLPGGIRSNTYVQSLVHPSASQVQEVLGYSAPRPKAPFEYTNAWGNNLSVFGVWFVMLVVAGGLLRRRWLRWVVLLGVLSVAAVPAIYSLNRGMWIGVGFSAVYVAVRLAVRRQYAPLGAMVMAGLVLGMAVLITPLGEVISERLEHGHSNQVRTSLSELTIKQVNRSPIIGYGSTRVVAGSADSIAIGRSPTCPKCGNFSIGSNGQLWQVLIAGGYAAAALYLGFFLYAIWRYRHDTSAIGIAASTVMYLALLYSLVYNAFPSPLAFYLLSFALLWRNDMRRHELASAAPPVLGGRQIAVEPRGALVTSGRAVVTGRRAYLLEMAALLWPGQGRVELGRGASPYLVVPSADAPRLLLPAAGRPAAAAVLGYGGHGSPRAWAKARVLAAALAVGGSKLAFRDRLLIGPGEPGLDAHLSELLGQEVLLALHIGPPRANRKPVLQLLTPSGETVGYAKLGVNDLTRRLVDGEASALRAVAAARPDGVRVPEVLHCGRWRGLALLVQSALPVRRSRPTPQAARVAAMVAVATTGTGADGYVESLRARLAALPDASTAAELLGTVEWAAAGEPLRSGAWHGDWTPWNTAYLPDRRTVLIWDWERYGTGVPLGYDALHHALQVAFAGGGSRHDHAVALFAAAPSLLEPFEVAAPEAVRTAALYLVEIATRYLADGQAAAGGAAGRVAEWLLPALRAAPAASDAARPH